MTGDTFDGLPEVERAFLAREYDEKQAECPLHGGSLDDCLTFHDPGREPRGWFPQRQVCDAAMELAAAEWRYDQLHEKRPFHDGTFGSWSEVRTHAHPYHFRDGVRIFVADSDLNPHDHFLGGASACEVCREAVERGDST